VPRDPFACPQVAAFDKKTLTGNTKEDPRFAIVRFVARVVALDKISAVYLGIALKRREPAGLE
jgi:hypothetical protein